MTPTLALLRDLPRLRLAWLVALMLAAALTEGVGVVILVPMLGLLGSDGATATGITAIDRALASGVVPTTLSGLLAVFVVLVTARALLKHAQAMAQTRLELELVDTWRQRLFGALLRMDWRALSAMRQSDNTSLLVANIDRLGYGFAQLLAIGTAGITLAVIWLAALIVSPLLALVLACGGTAVVAGFAWMRGRATALGTALGDAYRGVQSVLAETLAALRLVKSHGREDEHERQLALITGRLRQTQLDFTRAAGRSRIALQAGGALVLALTVWIASRKGMDQAMVLPLVALFARSLPLLDALQSGLQRWSHAAPALGEAQALLTRATANAEPPVPAGKAPVAHRDIAVAGVGIHHPGRSRAALADAALDLPVGTITVLTGASGAGKSTLADVIAGMITPDEGALSIDGVALEGEGVRAWRTQVAYVHQQPTLFHATIRENLLWAHPDTSEDRVKVALDGASAGFVHDLPDDLDTVVGDTGSRLSGGERQRIALARALLGRPQLLILDEATSALDPASEAAIVSAVRALRGSLTVLVIGHRGLLSEIGDRVVTLDRGRIVAIEERRPVPA